MLCKVIHCAGRILANTRPHIGSVCRQGMCVCRQGMVEWAQVVKSAKMRSDHDLIDVQTTFLAHPEITFMELTLGN